MILLEAGRSWIRIVTTIITYRVGRDWFNWIIQILMIGLNLLDMFFFDTESKKLIVTSTYRLGVEPTDLSML